MEVSLSDRPVQVGVEGFGAGGHLRLQHLHAVKLHKLVDGVFRILEIRQLARAGGAGSAAGRGQSLGNAVVFPQDAQESRVRPSSLLPNSLPH